MLLNTTLEHWQKKMGEKQNKKTYSFKKILLHNILLQNTIKKKTSIYSKIYREMSVVPLFTLVKNWRKKSTRNWLTCGTCNHCNSKHL